MLPCSLKIILLGSWGNSCIIFRDFGSTRKIILGSRGKYFIFSYILFISFIVILNNRIL